MKHRWFAHHKAVIAGYPDRPRGFYDATGSGIARDYGRWVGDHPLVYWSVALGTATGPEQQYSAPGVYDQPEPWTLSQPTFDDVNTSLDNHNAPVPTARVVESSDPPRPPTRVVTDWGASRLCVGLCRFVCDALLASALFCSPLLCTCLLIH